MDYKVVDYDNEIIEDGFSTEGSAWNWVYFHFTTDYIKDISIHVVKDKEE